MAIPANSVVGFQVRGTLFNQRILLSGHLRVVTTSSLALIPELVAIGNVLAEVGPGDWLTNMLKLQGSQYFVDSIRVQQQSAVRSPYVSIVVGESGTHADACTAQNVAAILNKRCMRGGHHQNSPTHLAGVPDTQYDEGELKSAYVNLINVWGANWLAGINPATGGGSYNFCNWDRSTLLIDSSWDFFDFNVNPYLRVERRRTVGLGI